MYVSECVSLHTHVDLIASAVSRLLLFNQTACFASSPGHLPHVFLLLLLSSSLETPAATSCGARDQSECAHNDGFLTCCSAALRFRFLVLINCSGFERKLLRGFRTAIACFHRSGARRRRRAVRPGPALLAAVAPPVCCVNKSKTNNDPERHRRSKNNFQSSPCSVNTERG